MGFAEVLESHGCSVVGTLPTVQRRDRRDRLLELTRFDDSATQDGPFVRTEIAGDNPGARADLCGGALGDDSSRL